MIKIILIALLSFQVSANDNEAYMVAGLCKVMMKQVSAENITPEFLKYWQDQAKDADMSFKKYYDLCKSLSVAYDREDAKQGETAKTEQSM